MLYLDHVNIDGTVAIGDTDDGVLENISRAEACSIQASGVDILSWDALKRRLTDNMKMKSLKCFVRKLKAQSDYELYLYLKRYCFYPITDILNRYNTSLDLDRLCRLFDYTVTDGYIIVVLGLRSGHTLFINIGEDLTYSIKVVEGVWSFSVYPSVAGLFFNSRALKHGVSLNLTPDETYLYMQDNRGRILFFNQFTDNYVIR